MSTRPRMDIYPSAELRRAIDRWRASKDDPPPRAEAARMLIELGLTVEGMLVKQIPLEDRP